MTRETSIPTRARVSIFERLVPSLAFTACAASGAIGGILILRLFESVRANDDDGFGGSFFAEASDIVIIVGLLLLAAVAIGGIALLVSVIRIFTTTKTASPPGALFLVLGLLSLLPPLLVHFILHILEKTTPREGGIWAVETTVTALCYVAPAIAVVVIFGLFAFTFIPFNSRPGRKVSPTICLFVIEILTIALLVIFFWQVSKFGV